MLKTQPILIIACTVRNNLIKSVFRNFSQTVYKSKTNTWSSYIGYKCLLQPIVIYNATQKSFLSKLTSVPKTNNPQSTPESFLDGVVDINDEEKWEEMLNIVKLLLSHGCSEEEIKQCLEYAKNTQNAYFKVKLLLNFHSNIAILFPLLACHIVSLRAAAKHVMIDNSNNIGFPNRIEYLLHNLEIPPDQLIPKITKHPSLLTMPFKRLHNKMTILKQAQISSEYIQKDLWIFNYNEKLLQNRISTALKAGVELKPWMLRCSEKFFESMLTKWAQTQDILKGDDEVSYLAKKLDCSEDYVKVMMEKNKYLKTINIPKIDEVITFLYEEDYTAEEIRLFPRVFCSSVQTLRKRLDEFRKIRNTLPTISQLCLSSKNFEETKKKKSTK